MFEKYWGEELARALLNLAGEIDQDGQKEKDLTDALEWIQAAAENKYNPEYWRTLQKVLYRIGVEHSVELPFC